jgi:uncharacterized Zn finger protein
MAAEPPRTASDARRSGRDELTGGWAGLLPGTARGDALHRRRAQGGAFYRSGRVAGLRVGPGRLTASVQGARATPYHVEVLVPVLGDAAWSAAVRAIASELRFAAALLAERWPAGLLAELAAHGVELLPDARELDVRCPCGEAERPCAHLVALWAAATDRFQTDPFALLQLRGRGRQRLLAELSGARGARRTGPHTRLPLHALPAADWTRAPAPLEDLDVAFPRRPEVTAAPLRLLGDPPGWTGTASAVEVFAPLVTAAAAHAEQVLRGEGPSPAEPPDSPG